MNQDFKLLTSWYQIPLLDCEHKLKEHCLEICSKEINIVAIAYTGYIVVLGFYSEDLCFDKPILSSYQGFGDYDDYLEIKEHLIKTNNSFNIYLPNPDLKKGEIFITKDLHQYLKDVIFIKYLNGGLIESKEGTIK